MSSPPTPLACSTAPSLFSRLLARLAPPTATAFPLGLMLMGSVGLWLSFPNNLFQLPFLVILYPMALFLLGQKAPHALEALRRGWLTGLVGSFAALYWLAVPIKNVGGLPWALALPCAMFMGAYVGLYGGIFALISHHLQRLIPHAPLRLMLSLSCVWYFLELLRNVAFTGFPWLSLSSAMAPYPLFIQGANVVGAYGLSAVFVMLGLCLAQSLQKNLSLFQRQIHFGVSIGIFLILLSYGFYSFEQKNYATQEAFPVVMVEGNVDQNVKWEKELQQKTLDTYTGLSQQALSALRETHPKAQPLLIWPETAMPFYLEHHPQLGQQLLQFIAKAHTPLLVGAPAVNINEKGHNIPFNRAYSISETTALLGYYDKVHLVPFGEYVPPWLHFNFLEGLLQSIGAFTAGTQENPLKNIAFTDPNHPISLALGVLICYEGIFPELAQRRVHLGANVLVNISNDGWFGDSAAPLQHLQLTTMRAVEQGRWLIRNTNTGISAIISPHGEVMMQGGQFKAQSLTTEAYTRQEYSLFHVLYAFMPWTMCLICSLSLGSALLGKNRSIT